MTAVTGYEQAMVDTLVSLLPGAARDRVGNAVLVLGSGARARLVACPISEPGWVVGRVRPDGWLTLRRAPGRVPPALDRQLEGQPVTLFGRRLALPGVVAVRSIHLTRGRGPAETTFSLDSAYVDIGAATAAQAAAAGVAPLTPVSLAKLPQRYGRDLLAAPVSGRRVACAALLLAARRAVAEQGMVPRGERLVIAFVVGQELDSRGLGTVANTLGPFVESLVVDGGAGPPGALLRWADSLPGPRPALGIVTRWSLGARYAGTPVESTSLGGADSLRDTLVAWMAGRP
jgi:putative aminopeptidase FrvX